MAFELSWLGGQPHGGQAVSRWRGTHWRKLEFRKVDRLNRTSSKLWSSCSEDRASRKEKYVSLRDNYPLSLAQLKVNSLFLRDT